MSVWLENHLFFVFLGILALGTGLYFFKRQFAIRRKCPACGELDLERMNRIGWRKKIPFIKVYRCRNCMHVFVRYRKL